MKDRTLIIFGWSGIVVGLGLAVLCFVNGWREPFMQTSWLVGLGVAALIIERGFREKA